MANQWQHRIWIFAIVLVLMGTAMQAAHAQSFSVLHTFTGGADGANPYDLLTIDAAGNLYGTTFLKGAGYGTVFKLTHRGSNWLLTTLYEFKGAGAHDGAGPYHQGVIFGPDGTLYGTTASGGNGPACPNVFDQYSGCGTVFNLRPPAVTCKSALCPWTETVLYTFQGGSDGAVPYGNLVFDHAGNLYVTTYYGGGNCGGINNCGAVYKLTRSGGGWTKSVVYNFTGSDGANPGDGVSFDNAGNLYGTTLGGGAHGYGTVFKLTPSGSGWTESVLYSFQGGSDGYSPYAAVIFDQAGNLYGTTESGTAFELTPSDGSWTFTLLHSFVGVFEGGSHGRLVMDVAGNLYGTTQADDHDHGGTAFMLTPSDGSWIYTELHDFTGGSDGGDIENGLALGSNGHLYGTAAQGGSQGVGRTCQFGCGVVFEITP